MNPQHNVSLADRLSRPFNPWRWNWPWRFQKQYEYDPRGRPGAKALEHSRWRAALRLCRCAGCAFDYGDKRAAR
jgi:hypothetical protein